MRQAWSTSWALRSFIFFWAMARTWSANTRVPASWAAHTPGLKVALPSTPADAKGLFTAALREVLLLLEAHIDFPDDDLGTLDSASLAARVAAVMRDNRVGVLGHYYCGMLDVYSDMTQQAAVFGCHFELLEMCELHALRQRVTKAATRAKVAEFRRAFDVSRES